MSHALFRAEIDLYEEGIARSAELRAQMEKGVPISAWQTHQIHQVLRDFFSDAPGIVWGVKHHILTPLGKVIWVPFHPMPIDVKELLEKEVEYMLQLGFIQEFTSPWRSLPVLIPKPNGSISFMLTFVDSMK